MPKDDSLFVEEFQYGSAAYRDACTLRHAFLRLPLGLELTAADTADDADQLHFGLFTKDDEGKQLLLGGCICKPVEGTINTMQFRQVVIDEAWRSRGLGYQLMLDTEKLLTQQSYSQFLLYAREEAVPFYEHCGYQQTGETVELIGISHFRMVKRPK